MSGAPSHALLEAEAPAALRSAMLEAGGIGVAHRFCVCPRPTGPVLEPAFGGESEKDFGASQALTCSTCQGAL